MRHLAVSRPARATGNSLMIGIIGGTGLYRMESLELRETREVDTPFGPPSSPVMLGALGGRGVAFLARHGMRHDLLPSEINFRANVWALKSLGVRTIIRGIGRREPEGGDPPGRSRPAITVPGFHEGTTRGKLFRQRRGRTRLDGAPDVRSYRGTHRASGGVASRTAPQRQDLRVRRGTAPRHPG